MPTLPALQRGSGEPAPARRGFRPGQEEGDAGPGPGDSESAASGPGEEPPLASGLRELQRRSASFQGSLGALCASHASQLALLEALLRPGGGGCGVLPPAGRCSAARISGASAAVSCSSACSGQPVRRVNGFNTDPSPDLVENDEGRVRGSWRQYDPSPARRVNGLTTDLCPDVVLASDEGRVRGGGAWGPAASLGGQNLTVPAGGHAYRIPVPADLCSEQGLDDGQDAAGGRAHRAPAPSDCGSPRVLEEKAGWEPGACALEVPRRSYTPEDATESSQDPGWSRSLYAFGEADDSPRPQQRRIAMHPRSTMVEVHRFWTKTPNVDQKSQIVAAGSFARAHGASLSSEESHHAIGSNSFQDEGSCARGLVVRPGSRQHLAHALACLIVVAYDVIMMPVIAAFRLEGESLTLALDATACTFWSLDIVNNFRTGYNEMDRVEMRLGYIARRYLRGWFFFDTFVLCLDLANFVLRDVHGLGFARILKAPRILRAFLRVLRLLRLIKMMVMVRRGDWSLLNWIQNGAGIAKMMCCMIVFNHFVACVWYLVGDATSTDPLTSWILPLDEMDPPASTMHRYVVSFHWSMCQYTPAPNDYHPVNFLERACACVILLFGLAIFSWFVGTITSVLTHMNDKANEKIEHNQAMRQYLVSNRIGLDVATRIGTFLKNRQSGVWLLSYSEVEYFRHLPASLAGELKRQAHSQCLRMHPVVRCFDSSEMNMHHQFILDLCHKGTHEKLLMWGDELLIPRDRATHTVFAKAGHLEYFQKVAAADWLTIPSQPVLVGPRFPKKWACETALWCDWAYLGQLCAKETCVVLMVEADLFRSLVQAHICVFSEMQDYATGYTRLLKADLENPESAPGVDDLWGQSVAVRRLVDEVFQFSLAMENAPIPRGGRSSASLAGVRAPGIFQAFSWLRWLRSASLVA